MSCQKEQVDFNAEVRPILNNHCMSCHGGVKQNGDLSFLFPETAILPGRSGKKAIIPGNASKSELIKRIKSAHPEKRMPLDAPPLSPDQIDILERWIDDGAEWEKHWSYLPPTVTNISQDNQINKYGIDYFIKKKLSGIGLTQNNRAAKDQLLRRLSLDIIGLPPNVEQVNTIDFNNDQSVDTYIDSLLASPHYGEKWASMWLDLARYADSRGYQKDIIRPNIWRYRDYVIHAFNQDKPFDQFTIEQLAGDLIPNPNDEQILATAFHRNTMTNDEGGTSDEEFRVAAVIDRVNTTMEVWQGMTFGCVQCHSHPYDPIEHKEFYKMMAYFNNTVDTDNYMDAPLRSLMSPIQADQKKQLQNRLAGLQKEGQTTSPEHEAALKAFVAIQPGNVPIIKELASDQQRANVVFEKGNWLVHGDTVTPDVPNIYPEGAKNIKLENRLDLAQWLVNGENPLTARVFVNRIWEQLFGAGIVTSLEDFGTIGEKPSHPELLDYLAHRFVHEHQWSVKSLIKEIVLSETYQQSSLITEEQLKKDPNNKYLSRGPRYRLSAEQIRDQALALSGLLNPTVYGPSVMPHQPEGVWNVIRHVASWDKAEDGNQYRRALYTFWRRVSPYPSMISFDVPTRELCVSRRIRTNTPLQALITLNDPVYVEAAEALSKLMQEKEQLTDQISAGFERVLFRKIDKNRLNVLTNLYHEIIKLEKDKEAAHDIAMFQIASTLLNLDEVLMKA